ncbi:hypothetical protein GGTG_02584 [Gaeumannomyces tritici R3-111a-1]|uniref:Uncharacterized protein n=1 Tax=Gaeumannomyces tritici (strain R3-111a-1) TaxID=644352 RepID=J3NMS8_GAET3|nr:hypothetical protein GGTG_02584 [Gaeumannomyces tritici R3-111a-1]EJT77475.1 hypothetical protein GGTG_02584 [Gaeumannomyces tritici R3-111a-1]
MPVPRDHAGRVKRVPALPEKSVFDDVLYLGTVERRHAPPQNGVPDDDVVYLGTVNRGHAMEEALERGLRVAEALHALHAHLTEALYRHRILSKTVGDPAHHTDKPRSLLKYWMDWSNWKNVQYVTRFGGMTRQQVKAEVYRILEAASMDTGVV